MIKRINDPIIFKLMANSLKLEYEVKRVKLESKFKRGVFVDGDLFFLPKDKIKLKRLLYSKLWILYCPSASDIDKLLTDFYGS